MQLNNHSICSTRLFHIVSIGQKKAVSQQQYSVGEVKSFFFLPLLSSESSQKFKNVVLFLNIWLSILKYH